MAPKKNFAIVSLFLIVVVCANLLSVRSARADGETPTEPPVATQMATEPPVEPAPPTTTLEPTLVPEEPTAEATATEVVASASVIDSTDLVILDEQGQSLIVGSQEAADVMATSDPVWCPEAITVPTPGANGCSPGYASIPALLAAMQADPESFSQNGTIFLEKAEFTVPLVLDDSGASLGTSFNSLSLHNLTIQGGWNPATGSTSDQTVFAGPDVYVQVGSLSNPWIGALALNNISVTGSTLGQDNIVLYASNVALTNVSAEYSDRHGIAITASQPGTVDLNNVNASNNGHMEGSDPVGSGVYISGADTLVNVVGGSFTNNARYGIEAWHSTSTTLPLANVWTDQDDYAPGSVVTISGNDNSLNGDQTGFIFGESVHVEVKGPNGYTASCEATANSYGAWSCQITLWSNELAVGNYIYIATGMRSGVVQTGTFADSMPTKLTVSPPSITVAPGGSAGYNVAVTMGGSADECTITLSVTSVLPAGVVASFSSPNPTTTNASFSRTLTLSTTGLTPTGSHQFTVQAAKGANCQGNSTPLTITGTLVVNAAVTSTPTGAPTSTSTATQTLTNTPTSTATNTPTNTPTDTPTNTPTNTPINPPTDTPTNTPTNTPIDTATNTPTGTPTDTPDSSVTSTATATQTSSIAPTLTETSSIDPGAGGSVGGRRTAAVPGPSAFVIPLTGGEMIDLDCNSVIWAFGIRINFLNLCDQQTTIHSVGADGLPASLPAGNSLLLGIELDILNDGQVLESLPDGAGIEFDFPLRSTGTPAVLYWDETARQWVEISTSLERREIPEALLRTTGDELYRLVRNQGSIIFPVLTTDQTGIFVLVSK